MSRLIIFVAVVMCSMSFAPAAPVWSDGFETGGFSSWNSSDGNWAVVTSGLSAHGGNRGADIKGSTLPDDDVLSVTVPTLDYTDVVVSYWFKVRDTLEVGDVVSAEWSIDNVNWQNLASYTEFAISDWNYAEFALPAEVSNAAEFTFRMRANLSSATDRMNFDDFSITATPISSVPEPSVSMFILGLAGLLLSRFRAQ